MLVCETFRLLFKGGQKTTLVNTELCACGTKNMFLTSDDLTSILLLIIWQNIPNISI